MNISRSSVFAQLKLWKLSTASKTTQFLLCPASSFSFCFFMCQTHSDDSNPALLVWNSMSNFLSNYYYCSFYFSSDYFFPPSHDLIELTVSSLVQLRSNKRQLPHFYIIKVWRHHLVVDTKRCVYARVTFQRLLLVCTFGVEKCIEERLTKL